MQAKEFTFENDEDYRIPHRAPMHDSGSPLYDVTGTYPDDIYGPNGVRYYGTREPWDARSIHVIKICKGKPNQTIQIFRAVPKEVKSNTINPGDWVTASREYATQHGKGLGKYKVLTKIVPAKTLFTNGDSIHEWGYDPTGAAQPVAESKLNELRDRMYQYIKSIVPTWPDYVVQDLLYANRGKGNTGNDGIPIKNDILDLLKAEGLTPNTKWQLIPNMKFSMDMWAEHTLRKLKGRVGGSSDMGMNIPRDAERHTTQAALAQQQGGVRKEPVIIIKTPQGYELLEGWHRTIQHFAMYPNGYVGPAYVAQSTQPVAENFADGKGPGRPGDSVRHGIPKKATMAELEKASHSAGRKGQLARWQLNMRRGKAKRHNESMAEGADDEIHNYKKLDHILATLCELVVQGQQHDPEKYGMVAACVLDPDNRVVTGINLPASDGKRRHAERVAIDQYHKEYGKIPPGSIILTTCSPCSEHMDERYGEDCTQLINSTGVKKVYCGFDDPTQPEQHREFNCMETANRQIRTLCSKFAEQFLDTESKQPVSEAVVKKSNLKTYAARVRLKQTGYTNIVDATVSARNPEMARRLLHQLYGGNSSVVGQPREIK